jgi:hypothetical protein
MAPENQVRPTDLCELPRPEETRQFGINEVQNGTLGVLYVPQYAEGWYRVRLRVCLNDSYSDFPIRVYIPAVAETAQAIDAIASTGPALDLHDGSATNCTVLTTIPDGTPLNLLGRNADSFWFYVRANGSEGWVRAATVLVLTPNIEQLDIIDGLTTCTVMSATVPISNRVLFANDASGLWQIYRFDSGNGELVQLTFEGDNEYPTASPDGSQIAFVSNRNGNSEIYLMNVDGTNHINLTANGANDYRPAWSPDGSRLLFESDRSGQNMLYSMTMDTHTTTPIALVPGVYCCVAWASDAQNIAFAANLNSNYDIYRANLDGSHVLNLTDSFQDEVFPAWNPEGTTIAFQRKDDAGYWQIFTIQSDGSSLRQLTFSPRNNTQPQWINGQIAYSSEREGGLDIYIMNIDGTGEHPLIAQPGADAGVAPAQ